MKALTLYAQEQEHKFAFSHCWEVLKNEPKWNSLPHESASQDFNSFGANTEFNSTDINDDVDPSLQSSGQPTSSSKRPLGRDSSKCSKKQVVSPNVSSSAEFISDLKMLALDKVETFKGSQKEKNLHFAEFLGIERMKVQLKEEQMRRKEAWKQQQFEAQQEDKKKAEKKEKERELQEILQMDFNSLPDRVRAYYEKKKAEVLDYLEQN